MVFHRKMIFEAVDRLSLMLNAMKAIAIDGNQITKLAYRFVQKFETAQMQTMFLLLFRTEHRQNIGLFRYLRVRVHLRQTAIIPNADGRHVTAVGMGQRRGVMAGQDQSKLVGIVAPEIFDGRRLIGNQRRACLATGHVFGA